MMFAAALTVGIVQKDAKVTVMSKNSAVPYTKVSRAFIRQNIYLVFATILGFLSTRYKTATDSAIVDVMKA